MSEDEADIELLDLLRASLAKVDPTSLPPRSTGVLESAEYVTNSSIDVSISPFATKSAAHSIRSLMREKNYSTAAWSAHDLHPKPEGGEATLNFIFTMDLLNFSFWSQKSEEERFAVEFRGRRWSGYWSLVACLQRGLEEGMLSCLFMCFVDVLCRYAAKKGSQRSQHDLLTRAVT
jgi:Potential Queuosine, Q, salvage protein family